MAPLRFQVPEAPPKSNFQVPELSQFEEWADRNSIWEKLANPPLRRARRARNERPLVLCGHGVSLNVDRGALLIKDGLTHYPQERRVYRFHRGELDLPPRIVVLDGSGSISFDVLSWLSEQRIPLVRIDWRGEIVSVVGGTGYAPTPERVAWQIQTRNDPLARSAFASSLIAEKLRRCVRTLVDIAPSSKARDVAIARCEANAFQLERQSGLPIEEIRMAEAQAASAYFAAWRGVPLKWRSLWKHPVPETWKTIGARGSSKGGRFVANRNARHPVNALLNYAYGALRSQVHIQAAAEGFDPYRGIMHHDRSDTQAFVYDLIEPLRPAVDAAVFKLVQTSSLTGADFVLRGDGVCRVSPQLARVATNLAHSCALELPAAVALEA